MLSRLRLRFVLATGVSVGEVTFEFLALKRANQVRPDTTGSSGSAEAHVALRGYCRGRNYLPRDGSPGKDHPTNV